MAGIEAMMKASKPGMYEYQYKAEFDYALAQRGVLSPGFSVYHFIRKEQL